jgi:Xaa-Pro aminopeptidase
MNKRLFELKRSIKNGYFFFVSSPSDIFYLTNFSGTFSRVIISNEKNYFITDKRYEGVVRNTQISNFYEVIIINDYKKEIKKILKKTKKVFISQQTLLTDYLWLREINLKPEINNLISDLRMIKDKQEIDIIKKSIEITEKGILHISSLLKSNITELDLANEFEYYIKKTGADSVSFSPIIAFGKNSSVPHYKTGNDKLKENTFILMDVGARYNGYCSDLTRVIGYRIIKSRLNKYIKNYNIVKTAKNQSVFLYKSNNLTKKPYIFVKKFFKKYRYDKYFTHSLGHGIGIDIHEKPNINKTENIKFKPGMTVTCEPGIYFNNEYGIRIEDDYLITDNGPVKLTNLKDDIILKE